MGDFFESIFSWLVNSIKSFFQSLINFFKSIADFFVSVWEWIKAFISDFFNWIWTGLCSLWETVSSALVDWYTEFIDSIFELIPDFNSLFGSHYSEVKPYLEYFGDWFAVDVAISLLTAFLAYITVMITV